MEDRPELVSVRTWEETEDPTEIVAGLAGAPGTVAVGDRTWSRFLLDLQARLPGTSWRAASEVTPAPGGEGRVGGGCAAPGLGGRRPDRRPPAGGGCGPRRADRARRRRRRCCPDPGGGSPTRELRDRGVGSQCRKPPPRPQRPGDRGGEIVLFDFGGTMDGYCSDITRCVHNGEPPAGSVTSTPSSRALRPKRSTPPSWAPRARTWTRSPAGSSPRVATGPVRAPHGPRHRHGGPRGPLPRGRELRAARPGHAFSVEPGIYVEGRWGARIEDIVVATEAGPEALNTVDHGLAVVEA